MYIYIFKDGEIVDEIFTNETDSSLLWQEMERLIDMNGGPAVQTMLSMKRFVNPKIVENPIKEDK